MKYHIITIGKIKEAYLTAGMNEFLKRMKPFAQVEITVLAEEKMPTRPSPAEKMQVLEKEGAKLSAHIRDTSYIYALDVQGRLLSSECLAAQMEEQAVHGYSEFTFIIGGPFGLAESVRTRAHQCISFGRMTFTHQMMRLLLLEQLYRVNKIQRHEPYHW